jgi:hypothetical protein
MRISRVCKLLRYGGHYMRTRSFVSIFPFLHDFTVFICFAYSEEPSHLSYYGIY